jgi:tetratricopeptide (TPR) repeat protein
LSVWISSCEGTKQFIKKAQKYEKSRDYELAVVNYNEALLRDPDNNDARKGMKKAGQRLMNELVEDFNSSYTSKNCSRAIDQYLEIDRLQKNVERRKVNLEVPSDLHLKYKECVSELCREHYHSAIRAIDNRDYTLATDYLRRIEKLDATYENLGRLRTAIEADPIYMNAVDAYQRKQYSNAYNLFSQVNEISKGYRDTDKYLDELRRLYSVSLIIFPLDNLTSQLLLGEQVYRLMETEMKRQRSELLKIIDRETLIETMRKMNIPVNMPISDKDALAVAKNLQVTRYMLGTLTSLTYTSAPRKEETKVAYLRERILYWDQWSGTQMSNYQYREVKYKEVTEEVQVTLSMRYRIFESDKGEVTYSDVIQKSVINQVKFAEYNGVTDDLYPTTGYISQTDLRKWRSRFEASSDRKTDQELLEICVKELVRQWLDQMNAAVFR